MISNLYDESGHRYGVIRQSGSTRTYYYYLYNAQGDVIGIVNNNGTLVAQYTYNEWGEVISILNGNGQPITGTHIADLNPFRYRGYYYDVESGFYYLQSRYYDPHTGRFINADGQINSDILGTNLFAYCGNNPINCWDPSGQCAKAWAAGYSGPCPGQGMPGCMDNWPMFRKNYTDYLEALGNRESSNNYTAVNEWGYLGRYQMGVEALMDANFKDSSGSWSELANDYGVYSSEDFLNTPRAQDAAITAYNKKVCGYIQYYGLDTYVGTQYCGVTVTQSGLLASCHLVGTGSMMDALSTGAIVWDGNGVPASEYMSLMGGYDISEVWG